ncbi:ParB/RepB/Spo0J family partition protein [Acinetobacter tibetensis]|uniref:ParB/RepB/Spo0J family partition protein n=1 Tax=Acinetobacter tibetensis TaxID=2943497 RepID=UPI003A4D4709
MTYQTTQVHPDQLVPNPWNSNIVSPDNDAKLEESIKRYGMFKPVIVRELLDGTLQIIGGEHRAEVAQRLGLTSIPIVNLGILDDRKAKEISLVDNGRFGEDDSFKLAEILESLGDYKDLVAVMPLSIEDLNSVFTNSSIALEELESLALPDESEQLPNEKALQTHQVMRFKVPLKDVDAVTQIIEKTIKVQGFDDSDSMTNAGDALVHLLLKD